MNATSKHLTEESTFSCPPRTRCLNILGDDATSTVATHQKLNTTQIDQKSLRRRSGWGVNNNYHTALAKVHICVSSYWICWKRLTSRSLKLFSDETESRGPHDRERIRVEAASSAAKKWTLKTKSKQTLLVSGNGPVIISAAKWCARIRTTGKLGPTYFTDKCVQWPWQ